MMDNTCLDTCPTALKGFTMKSFLGVLAFAVVGPAWAADFAIDLKVEAGKSAQTAHASKVDVGTPPAARPVLDIKAGQRVQARWRLTCTAARQPVKDVLVHFFVVREKKTGQRALPKLDKTVTVESALTMDFTTGAQADGELGIAMDQPGVYLVRVETQGAAGAGSGSECFAALDLVVHKRPQPSPVEK